MQNELDMITKKHGSGGYCFTWVFPPKHPCAGRAPGTPCSTAPRDQGRRQGPLGTLHQSPDKIREPNHHDPPHLHTTTDSPSITAPHPLGHARLHGPRATIRATMQEPIPQTVTRSRANAREPRPGESADTVTMHTAVSDWPGSALLKHT